MFQTLKHIIFFPAGTEERYRRLHHLWLSACLTGLGSCVGLLTLLLSAAACAKLPGLELFRSYLSNPILLGLNLLPPVLLMWLVYFLTGRCWAAYLLGGAPWVLLSLVNYYKIQLRGDPLLGADLLLVSEAGGIAGHYSFEPTLPVAAAAVCFVLGLLFAILFLPRGVRDKRVRVGGVLLCAALLAGSYPTLYMDGDLYSTKTANNDYINPWSDVELFVSKGTVYPFLYSTRDMFPTPPEGYDPAAAQQLLESYEDADIPEAQKVDVVGVMLEAFCDLTDFPILADDPVVQQVYAPWRRMEEQGIYGDLITNIFAGGTVDSEWCFLSGYSQYDQFRSPTDSYVWYLRDQGYDALFHHPGYNWFYNRQNVNEYLGFRDSLFTENCFGSMVDPVSAVWHSDDIMVDYLLEELAQEREEPLFSFSVTYQNHGPYSAEPANVQKLTPEATGLSEESCNILTSYLNGVEDTIVQMERMLEGLEALDKPVVVVLFGDHKPWLGNGDSVYTELGVNFDRSTYEGFANYYGTPYLIWANSAAKEVLDSDFSGHGGDFSPCFLMPRVFDACGWEGPGFMQLARELRDIAPLVHNQNFFLQDGVLTQGLDGEDGQFFREFLGAQYYRETQVEPDK